MNVLVLFSYGSLRTIDDIPSFYQDIYHGHATREDIQQAIDTYRWYGKADPLGTHTYRIGRALQKKLELQTKEPWQFFVANRHASPSIREVAEMCHAMKPKRILSLSLTPYDSITGNQAYVKEFKKHLQAKDNQLVLRHIRPFYDHRLFVEACIDRVLTAKQWLSESSRTEAEIVFTMHSMPGLPEAHARTIQQYEQLVKSIAKGANVSNYHLAYRSGNPEQRWLEPDVLDVVETLKNRNVPAVIFVETLSVIENMEVNQEITKNAIEKARQLGIEAVQSEYLNDSIDFIEALENHVWEECKDIL